VKRTVSSGLAVASSKTTTKKEKREKGGREGKKGGKEKGRTGEARGEHGARSATVHTKQSNVSCDWPTPPHLPSMSPQANHSSTQEPKVKVLTNKVPARCRRKTTAVRSQPSDALLTPFSHPSHTLLTCGHVSPPPPYTRQDQGIPEVLDRYCINNPGGLVIPVCGLHWHCCSSTRWSPALPGRVSRHHKPQNAAASTRARRGSVPFLFASLFSGLVNLHRCLCR